MQVIYWIMDLLVNLFIKIGKMSRKHHYLKIKPEYYRAIEKGEKSFEVRNNDRDFQNGMSSIFRNTVEENIQVVRLSQMYLIFSMIQITVKKAMLSCN